MVYCFLSECKCHSDKTTCAFYRFPLANKKILQKWLANIRRKDKLPDDNSRICSCHFENKNPTVRRLKGPTIFRGYNIRSQSLKYVSPEKREKQLSYRKRRAQTSCITENCNEKLTEICSEKEIDENNSARVSIIAKNTCENGTMTKTGTENQTRNLNKGARVSLLFVSPEKKKQRLDYRKRVSKLSSITENCNKKSKEISSEKEINENNSARVSTIPKNTCENGTMTKTGTENPPRNLNKGARVSLLFVSPEKKKQRLNYRKRLPHLRSIAEKCVEMSTQTSIIRMEKEITENSTASIHFANNTPEYNTINENIPNDIASAAATTNDIPIDCTINGNITDDITSGTVTCNDILIDHTLNDEIENHRADISTENIAVTTNNITESSPVIEDLEKLALKAEIFSLREKNDELKNSYLSKRLQKRKEQLDTLTVKNEELLFKFNEMRKQEPTMELKKLQEENKKLEKEKDEMKDRVTFGIHWLTKEKLMLHYTGIPMKAFESIVEISKTVKFNYIEGYKPSNITFENQVLLTLIKLRLNPTNIDLALRFGISASAVSNVFRTLLEVLHTCLYKTLMSDIPSQPKCQLSLPSAFAPFHQNCRAIFDCTEFPCEKPSAMNEQRLLYSSYKSGHTIKVLVVVAPNGVITRVSKAYPGSTSDKKIVELSEILKEFQCGDSIMADKGFLLKDMVPQGVSVNIPPFLCTPQFTVSEVDETRKIAKARIHVERAIGRIKCFRIVKYFTRKMFPYATEIIQLCAALTNFRNPLIKEVGHLYTATKEDDNENVIWVNPDDIDDPEPIEVIYLSEDEIIHENEYKNASKI